MESKFYVFVRWTKGTTSTCQGGALSSMNTEKEALADFMCNLFKTENMDGWTLEFTQVLEIKK